MTASDTREVSVRDKASRFFVIGSFALLLVAAALMMAGGAGMLLVPEHSVPPYVVAFGAGMYGLGLLSFVAGIFIGVAGAAKLVEVPAEPISVS